MALNNCPYLIVMIIMCLHTVIWSQVFLFDTNNLNTVIWFHSCETIDSGEVVYKLGYM